MMRDHEPRAEFKCSSVVVSVNFAKLVNFFNAYIGNQYSEDSN